MDRFVVHPLSWSSLSETWTVRAGLTIASVLGWPICLCVGQSAPIYVRSSEYAVSGQPYSPTKVVGSRTSCRLVRSNYDTRAFGDFGWAFVNAGEQYRKLHKVSKEDALMMCGIFKQATMGDCLVEEARRNEQEITQREEWLKHKGMDHIDAMQLYIDKVKELAQIYEPRPEGHVGEEKTAEVAKK